MRRWRRRSCKPRCRPGAFTGTVPPHGKLPRCLATYPDRLPMPLHVHIHSLRVQQALPFCAVWLTLLSYYISRSPANPSCAHTEPVGLAGALSCGAWQTALDCLYPTTLPLFLLRIVYGGALCCSTVVHSRLRPTQRPYAVAVQEGVQRRRPCVSVRSLRSMLATANPREDRVKHGTAAEK